MTYVSPFVQLLGGSYENRSIKAGAQRCVNLYVEDIPTDEGESNQKITQLTPGLRYLSTCPQGGQVVRQVYTASNGDLYAIVGQKAYYIDSSWVWTDLGSIAGSDPTLQANALTPASMVDNGTKILIADGTPNGFLIDMTTRVLTQIDVNTEGYDGWYGADYVDYTDTFFLANKPETPIYYCSGSVLTTFDAIDFASKAAKPDNLVAVAVTHRVIWLIGQYSTEVHSNTGGNGSVTSFPFEAIPGVFYPFGAAAKYSVAKQDNKVFFLGQDKSGGGVVMMGEGTTLKRISTHAIEQRIAEMSRFDDAIGYCYSQLGHYYYVLTFPTADQTWVFASSTMFWHERVSIDSVGVEHRHRSNCATYAYGEVVVGDYQNGKIYALDPDTYTDDGQPILRLRSFPHALDERGRKVRYNQFIANIECGNGSTDPEVSLRFSDTGGASWGEPIVQTLGPTGVYLTSVSWRRLGIARDRVWELSLVSDGKTSMNGAFVNAEVLSF